MPKIRLNLSTLRARCLPTIKRHTTPTALLSKDAAFVLNRREMLGTMAALGAMPVVKSVGTTVLGAVTMKATRDRIVFSIRGKDRWIIDTRQFGGTPRLSLNRTEQAVVVGLHGATFPGAGLAADFTCALSPAVKGWTMQLAMANGLAYEGPFESWLLHLHNVRASVPINHKMRSTQGSALMHLKGKASVTFWPDWTLEMQHRNFATIKLPEGNLQADRVSFRLADNDGPTLFNQKIKRRTLIEIDRDGHRWDLMPALTSAPEWDFHADANAFDRVTVETGQSSRGRVYLAIALEGADESGQLRVKPAPGLQEFDGQAVALPLRNAVYATSFSPAGSHTALRAGFATAPTWIHLGQQSVLVGDDDEHPVFEMVAQNGKLERLSCTPALLGTLVPPQNTDVIVHPIASSPGSRIAISTAKRVRQDEASGNLLHLKTDAQHAKPQLLLADLKVQMIRPEDFLTLGFEFYNIQLEDGGDDALDFVAPGAGGQTIQGPKLIAAGNAYMVVHFPPQHILEEVFPETEEDTITPTPPPVNSILAGQSRIAYKVPAGTVIPYSLEGLLEACETLQMNLAANAKAPKIELNVGILGGISAGSLSGLAPDNTPIDGVPAVRGAFKALRAQNNTTINQQLNQRFGQEAGVVRRLPANTTEKSATRAQRLIGEHRDQLVAKTSALAKAVIRESEVAAGAHQAGNFTTAGVVNQVTNINPVPKLPSPIETAIEAPFRMYLSPNEYAGWTHAALPKTSSQTGRTELWHSRMGIRYKGEISEDDFAMKSVRAIWADDYNPDLDEAIQDNDIEYYTSLSPADRTQIVRLSADFSIPNYEPEPVKAHQLMLSGMGAWLHVRGAWRPPSGLSVSEWVNRGTMGRDHYVKVVKEGVLFPFGNAAAKVEITERKFQAHPNDNNARVAYLRKREFIIVRQPEIVCGMMGTISEQRQMPFKRVELVTTITSLLDPTSDTVYWPQVNGIDFLFNVKMEDIAGEEHNVTMPLAFIQKDVVDNVGPGPDGDKVGSGLTIQSLREGYTGGTGNRNKHVLGGQSVTYTEAAIPGDTIFETVDLDFAVNRVDERPFFAPVITRANLVVPAVKHLLGDNAPDGATQVAFSSAYLNHGFSSNNQGEVFFDFLDNLGLNFDGKGEQSGGLIKPNMDVKAFSRKTGPVGGKADTFSGGQFNPEEFFSSDGAAVPVPLLFGVVKLWDIIEAVGLDDLDKIPKVVTEALDVVEFFLKDAAYFEDALQAQLQNAGVNQVTALVNDFKAIMDAIENGDINALPDPLTVVGHIDDLLAAIPGANLDLGFKKDVEKRLSQFRELLADAQEFIQLISNFLNAIEMAKEMKVRLEWRPQVKDWLGIFIAKNGEKSASMVLGVELRAKAGDGSGQPTADIFCSLDNFTIDLYIIRAMFSRVQFFATTGKKWGVDVVFDGIEFDGPLKWVEKLRELIPMDGFSDPPYVDIDTSGITAGFTQPIPSVAFGVFTVQNISLGAEINIPFIGDPATIQFNFNTRENPCTVTVMAIGGSFYFGITFDIEGLRSVEAAIEFGASIAFSIAVASGGVTLMAGIYFKYDGVTDEVTLTGYLRLSGHVSVLGLIGISLELRMELTYQSSGGKVIGRASVKVEIELLFFSIGVEITVERKFAGSNEDPTFLEQMGSSYIDPVQDQTVEAWPEYCMAFAD